MGKRFLYLDTFATVRVVSDPALAAATRTYIAAEGFTLVVGPQNLIEFVSWPKRWPEVMSFVSSVRFCVAQSPDEIVAKEICSYPDELASLPVLFCSVDLAASADEIRDALSNLNRKVADAERTFRNLAKDTLQIVVNKRKSFLPEKTGKYTYTERQMFMHSSVLAMLLPAHHDFLRSALAAAQAEGRKEGLNIERFKSAYIQALAVFLEFYVQKKTGKLSDLGDILQLSLVPYVDLAVLDNERNSLIQRFNRERLFPGYLRACNFRDFTAIVMA
jgi:hypothetical protein